MMIEDGKADQKRMCLIGQSTSPHSAIDCTPGDLVGGDRSRDTSLEFTLSKSSPSEVRRPVKVLFGVL